jgi:hypothetical protein
MVEELWIFKENADLAASDWCHASRVPIALTLTMLGANWGKPSLGLTVWTHCQPLRFNFAEIRRWVNSVHQRTTCKPNCQWFGSWYTKFKQERDELKSRRLSATRPLQHACARCLMHRTMACARLTLRQAQAEREKDKERGLACGLHPSVSPSSPLFLSSLLRRWRTLIWAEQSL